MGYRFVEQFTSVTDNFLTTDLKFPQSLPALAAARRLAASPGGSAFAPLFSFRHHLPSRTKEKVPINGSVFFVCGDAVRRSLQDQCGFPVFSNLGRKSMRQRPRSRKQGRTLSTPGREQGSLLAQVPAKTKQPTLRRAFYFCGDAGSRTRVHVSFCDESTQCIELLAP